MLVSETTSAISKRNAHQSRIATAMPQISQKQRSQQPTSLATSAM
jgi:hypothetical protein